MKAEYDELFQRISASKFRSGFALGNQDLEYIKKKGLKAVRSHAQDFVSKRLAPAYIPNDGKQTPMRGHPVFPAQHATGCCCRGCLKKWHNIEAGYRLSTEQEEYIVDNLMEWITRQLEQRGIDPQTVYEPDASSIMKSERKQNKGSRKKSSEIKEEYVQLTLPFI